MDDAKIGCKSLALNSSYSEKKLKPSPKQDARTRATMKGVSGSNKTKIVDDFGLIK